MGLPCLWRCGVRSWNLAVRSCRSRPFPGETNSKAKEGVFHHEKPTIWENSPFLAVMTHEVSLGVSVTRINGVLSPYSNVHGT